jgi:hypothetical protein
MSKRINFNYWGAQRLRMPAYAMMGDAFSRIDAVCRAIARSTGLAVANCRGDGTALDRHGRPEADHYELTLGRPLRSGGYSVEGRLWVSLPAHHKEPSEE